MQVQELALLDAYCTLSLTEAETGSKAVLNDTEYLKCSSLGKLNSI